MKSQLITSDHPVAQTFDSISRYFKVIVESSTFFGDSGEKVQLFDRLFSKFQRHTKNPTQLRA
jgi:hypothetical protein